MLQHYDLSKFLTTEDNASDSYCEIEFAWYIPKRRYAIRSLSFAACELLNTLPSGRPGWIKPTFDVGELENDKECTPSSFRSSFATWYQGPYNYIRVRPALAFYLPFPPSLSWAIYEQCHGLNGGFKLNGTQFSRHFCSHSPSNWQMGRNIQLDILTTWNSRLANVGCTFFEACWNPNTSPQRPPES